MKPALGTLVVAGLALSIAAVSSPRAAQPQPSPLESGAPARTPAAYESAWFRDGKQAVARAKALSPITSKAKNVILFVGDGMSVATVTAARILEGQRRGMPGEENLLSFERLPYTALVKTYNTNQQVSDSAGTMSAMVTGVKTGAGILSLDDRIARGDFAAAAGHQVTTLLELAEKAGLSTGVVTTTSVTHATPAACYAHSPERDWECDADLSEAARSAGFPDIARQLLEFPHGNGPEVVLGGGRRYFAPRDTPDVEYPDLAKARGRRLDGRDLVAEWQRRPDSAYVWNKVQFDAIDVARTKRLLGLFEADHMQFEWNRQGDSAGEPSLAEMTTKAVDILSRNEKGFFLMVEGGRIDHAHHANNPYRALSDTVALADAVRVVLDKTKRDDTLVVVTADHGHTMTISGYGVRGNPILGKVITFDESGSGATRLAKDELGLPYAVLSYANGPGYTGASKGMEEGIKTFPPLGWQFKGITKGRPDLNLLDTSNPDFVSEATVPLESETHGGEDVALYADGPQAHLFRGVIEQNVVFHVIVEAFGF